jgi:chemotaxis protein MotD
MSLTMTTASISNHNFPTTSGQAALSARQGEGHQDDVAYADLGALPLAFDALLKNIQAAAPMGSLQESTGKTSASQIFEPASANPHERREAVMRADDQSPGRDAKYATADPTDVESRLARHADRSTASGDRSIEDRSGDGSSTSTSLPRVRSLGGFEKVMQGDPIQAHRGQGSDAPMNSNVSDQRSVVDVNRAAPLPPPGGESGSMGTTAATGAVRAVGAASGAKASSPAHQLATLLGGARGGEVETGRAVTSTPNDARTSGEQQSSTQRSLTDSKSSGTSDSARSSQEADRTGEAGRSKFDELVRSIRLHTTPRRSSARMQLQPPELGRVSVDLRVEGDRVRIAVRAESDDARTLLAERGDQLKAALEQHGITVEKFEVSLEAAVQNSDNDSGHADSALDDQLAGRGGNEDQGSARTQNDEAPHDEWGSSPDENEIEATAMVTGVASGPDGIDIRI